MDLNNLIFYFFRVVRIVLMTILFLLLFSYLTSESKAASSSTSINLSCAASTHVYVPSGIVIETFKSNGLAINALITPIGQYAEPSFSASIQYTNPNEYELSFEMPNMVIFGPCQGKDKAGIEVSGFSGTSGLELSINPLGGSFTPLNVISPSVKQLFGPGGLVSFSYIQDGLDSEPAAGPIGFRHAAQMNLKIPNTFRTRFDLIYEYSLRFTPFLTE